MASVCKQREEIKMKTVIMESLGISEERLQALEAPLQAKGMTFASYARTADAETLKEQRRDADAVIIANMPFGDDIIRACPQLKFIDVAFTGVDHVGLKAAQEKQIAVSNASGYSNEAVAELAVGTVLSSYRYLRETEDNCRHGQTKENYIGNEIKGKTVGIIGLGKIGMRSAELFHAFGAEIIASKKHPSLLPAWITLTDTDEVLKRADIVVLHCPLNEETRGMINAEKISLMKKNALLVNMARGPVVNAADLADALTKGTIAGAAADVFDKEPPLSENEPLLKAPHVIMTPHIGFATKEAMEIRAEIVFANLAAWMEGKQQNIIL